MNGIITLVTDLKDQDYYLGTVKGTIYSAFGGAKIVDISNTVPHFDVRQAAIMLKNSWKNFPEGTTHLALVEDRAITARRILMAEDSGHYFVSPDNGMFSLLFDELNLKIFELDKSIINPKNNRKPSRLLMALTAAKIALGTNLSELGSLKIDMVKKTFLAVGITDASISGAVVFIDQFNNMITNIMKDDFETIGKGRNFNISIRRGNWVNKIYNDFDEVAEGELLCHFNASGNLVVSINKMKSARLTGLQLESPLQIDFT